MKLKEWLAKERGRGVAFAAQLALTKDAISKASRYPTGIPDGWHKAVYEYTDGEVGYLDQLSEVKRIETIRRHKFIAEEIKKLPRAETTKTTKLLKGTK